MIEALVATVIVGLYNGFLGYASDPHGSRFRTWCTILVPLLAYPYFLFIVWTRTP